MKLVFDVTFDDGRDAIKVVVGPRDQLLWEQGGSDRVFGSLLTRAYKVGELYSLAHAALKRQGLYDGTLSELQKTADIELGKEDEPAADATEHDDTPTLAGPSTDR